MIKVLLTGTGGQLGKAVIKAAENTPQLSLFPFNAAQLDITNADQVLQMFETIQPNFCINCAAYTQVDLAEDEPEKAYAINKDGVENLAQAAIQHPCFIVHISTDYVFDGTKKSPYLPEDTTAPLNVYGASKRAGELVLQQMLSQYLIIRTSWLYDYESKNFYTSILKKARLGEPLTVTTAEYGCPTFVDDLAQKILQQIQSSNPATGIHHYSGNKAMTWYDFARQILEENNQDLNGLSPTDFFKTKARRPQYSVLKNTL